MYSHIEDIGASAAYWGASAASEITANAAAIVGSIGTYAVVTDLSAAAENDGVKVHVVRAGEYKGAGVPGTEVTDEQLAEVQRLINSRNDFFLRAVSSGRSLPIAQVRELADGRVHPAKDALNLRLIDRIASFDDAFTAARKVAQETLNSPKRTKQMAASPKDIKAACPGCSSDFVLECIESSLELAEAKDLHFAAIAEASEAKDTQIAELTAKVKDLESQLAKQPSASLGVDPMDEPAASTEQAGTPKEAYFAKVRELCETESISRAAAMQKVNKQFPELRRAMAAK